MDMSHCHQPASPTISSRYVCRKPNYAACAIPSQNCAPIPRSQVQQPTITDSSFHRGMNSTHPKRLRHCHPATNLLTMSQVFSDIPLFYAPKKRDISYWTGRMWLRSTYPAAVFSLHSPCARASITRLTIVQQRQRSLRSSQRKNSWTSWCAPSYAIYSSTEYKNGNRTVEPGRSVDPECKAPAEEATTEETDIRKEDENIKNNSTEKFIWLLEAKGG